jgi:hypothetical protein
MNCRHCGARLQELLLASDPIVSAPRAPAPQTAIKTVFYCLIVSLGVACGFSAIWPDWSARTAGYSGAPRTSKEPVYQTTAADLYKNYAAYEAAANLKTGTAAVQVSGTIKAVGENMFDETEIDLDVGEGSNSVTVTLDQSSTGAMPSLVKGGQIKVLCEDMSRILDRPIGQSCQVLE